MSRQIVSAVAVVRNAEEEIGLLLRELTSVLTAMSSASGADYEIILVDRGSSDGTVNEIEAAVQSVPQVRAYCLACADGKDPAYLAGMEEAIGDYVVLFDPAEDDPHTIPGLVDALRCGADIAIAPPSRRRQGGPLYRLLSGVFITGFKAVSGIDLRAEATRFRAMSKPVVAYVLRHENASLAHQTLPLTGGFRTASVPQPGSPVFGRKEPVSVLGGVRRALGLVTSTTTAPLRLTTAACAAAAGLSLLYSVYVTLVYALGRHVAPGWTTLSLQISGLFFLLSLAVAMLAEYVVHVAASSYRRPPYHVMREFRSQVITREQRLNVVTARDTPDAA